MSKAFKIGLVGTLIISLFSFVFVVHAVDLGTGTGSLLDSARQGAGYSEADDTTIASIIGMIIKVILSISGVLFTALLVYAGLLWMTARGEDDQVTKSKNIIRTSIIGLVITLGAYSISYFVVPRILDTTLGESTDADSTSPPVIINCCIDCGSGTIMGSNCSGATRRLYVADENGDCNVGCASGGSCGSVGPMEQSQCQ